MHDAHAPLSAVSEERPESDLLRIVTFLMGGSSKALVRSAEVRDLIAGLIGHVVVELGANSAPRCLHAALDRRRAVARR
jgi:hypothetical protein